MNRVAVTGVSGYVGQRLLHHLEGKVECLVGIDQKEPAYRPTSMPFYQRDIRDPEIKRILSEHRIDTVIHLAFLIPPFKFDRETCYDININGTKNILNCCNVESVRKLIYTSSTVVYGASSDHKACDEKSPLREVPYLDYSTHKILAEELCREFERRWPQKTITVLRVAAVIGPTAATCVSNPLAQKWLIGETGACSKVQFIHEDDVCGAILAALAKDVRGVFNVGADDPIPITDLIRWAGIKLIPLPPILFRMWYGLFWALRISPVPPNVMNAAFRMSLLADNTRLKSQLGFKPRYTTKEAFDSFMAAAKNKS